MCSSEAHTSSNISYFAGPRYIGECDEVRISPVVSRKGYLLFLEEKTASWVRRWVVVRRPFLFIYQSERDLVERGLVNLATAHIEYNEEAGQRIRAIFSLVTSQRALLVQCPDDKDVHEWLYAFNPLLAGEIRCVVSQDGEENMMKFMAYDADDIDNTVELEKSIYTYYSSR